ncbi:type II toxin-antitoxin system RelE family toxin, partial [Desulfocastanea catecholica]
NCFVVRSLQNSGIVSLIKASMPDCQGVKALTNHRYGYRLRVGHYRVLFDYDGEVGIVEIQEVKKRDERTY